LVFAGLTFVLDAAVLLIEASEFARIVEEGAGPWRSGFLSGFFRSPVLRVRANDRGLCRQSQV
jgi:heme/copper-type cytochrome/quinol oxidase subunit 3